MRTAIVTGGSKGFGRSLAGDLAREGWTVVIDGRDRRALADVVAEHGDRVRVVEGDVTDAAHRTALVDQALDVGGLELLVNNASTLGPTPLPSLRAVAPRTLLETFEVNVLAPLAMIQLTLPQLTASGGAVINVTSDAAVEPYAGWGVYGASKAALEQMSNVLSAEEPNLRVWWVDPGDMRTEMHQAAFPGEDISDRPLPEAITPSILRLLELRPPSGRVRAAELLSSDAA